jgi:hypothetical protein
MSGQLQRVEIPYPIDEEERVRAARRIEATASIAERGWFDLSIDAFVFWVRAPEMPQEPHQPG